MVSLPGSPTGEANDFGRPTKYRPEYARQAQKLCAKGATDLELANFFEVAGSTIALWKLVYEDFSDSVNAGKREPDELVENALLKRALGYSFDSVKINVNEGQVFETPFIELVHGDVAAQRFWLMNRRRDKWAAAPAPVTTPEAADFAAVVAADAPTLAPDESVPKNPVL